MKRQPSLAKLGARLIRVKWARLRLRASGPIRTGTLIAALAMAAIMATAIGLLVGLIAGQPD